MQHRVGFENIEILTLANASMRFGELESTIYTNQSINQYIYIYKKK